MSFTGWLLPVLAAVVLTLSACGRATGSESVLGAPDGELPAAAAVATSPSPAPSTSAPATTVPTTTELSPVSISIGPPTTSAALAQPTEATPDEDVPAADKPDTEATPDEPPAGEQETTTTTTSAPAETEPSTTLAPTTTAAPTSSTTATTVAPGSSTSSVPDPTTTTAATTPPVQIVEFRIAAGTGSSPWNSFDNPVRVRVGQVLRVHNDDSSAHAIHAGGSPFKHGQRIDPGGFQDHPVLSPHQPVNGSPQVYDHNNGRGAAFWVVAEG